MAQNDSKISKRCDVYSLGAILYKTLVGSSPTRKIASQIAAGDLHKQSPQANVYEVPFFAQHRVLSNEMCTILVKLLHENPEHRYQDLEEIRQNLL